MNAACQKLVTTVCVLWVGLTGNVVHAFQEKANVEGTVKENEIRVHDSDELLRADPSAPRRRLMLTTAPGLHWKVFRR